MASNDHDQGTQVHFCFDLSLPAGPRKVYVSICGRSRSLDPNSVTTVEGRETCKLCKRALRARHRRAQEKGQERPGL